MAFGQLYRGGFLDYGDLHGILLFAILCGYELFEETLEDVTRMGQEISCVELFRAAAGGREIID